MNLYSSARGVVFFLVMVARVWSRRRFEDRERGRRVRELVLWQWKYDLMGVVGVIYVYVGAVFARFRVGLRAWRFKITLSYVC